MADEFSYDPEACHGTRPVVPATTNTVDDGNLRAGTETDLSATASASNKFNPISRLYKWATEASKKGPEWTIKCRKLEDCPEGYPNLAAFMSSDYSFMIYRGFSYLHARVLLMHQDELVVLERELDNLDRADIEDGRGNRLVSRARDNFMARRENQERPREAVLTEIHQKLITYGELLKNARDLASFQRPSHRDYRSFRTWFTNEQPLVSCEKEFTECKEDLVSLHQGREFTYFDSLVDAMMQRLNGRITNFLFRRPEHREKTSNQHVHYYSTKRVNRVVTLVITSVIFILLVAPVVVMYELTSSGSRESTLKAIVVLVVFTLLFSAAMSILTSAKRQELFAASAGYCAVLVVFISNFGSLPS